MTEFYNAKVVIKTKVKKQLVKHNQVASIYNTFNQKCPFYINIITIIPGHRFDGFHS